MAMRDPVALRKALCAGDHSASGNSPFLDGNTHDLDTSAIGESGGLVDRSCGSSAFRKQFDIQRIDLAGVAQINERNINERQIADRELGRTDCGEKVVERASGLFADGAGYVG